MSLKMVGLVKELQVGKETGKVCCPLGSHGQSGRNQYDCCVAPGVLARILTCGCQFVGRAFPSAHWRGWLIGDLCLGPQVHSAEQGYCVQAVHCTTPGTMSCMAPPAVVQSTPPTNKRHISTLWNRVTNSMLSEPLQSAESEDVD